MCFYLEIRLKFQKNQYFDIDEHIHWLNKIKSDGATHIKLVPQASNTECLVLQIYDGDISKDIISESYFDSDEFREYIKSTYKDNDIFKP